MRVLVVEDDQAIRNFLKVSLEKEHFAVDTAEEGKNASYLARTNDYDIVVLDNILPGKTGGEICADIRASGKTMPILMLSVRADVNSKVSMLQAGADDYVAKPFSFDEVLARVKVLLRRPKQIVQDVLSLDTLVLDTRTQTVSRDGHQVYLTRKEFTLLEYFMRNIDSVLSRGMLVEHVWDMALDPFSNTIEAHMVSLRKKIDTNKKKKLIHTVPGRGYKMALLG